MSKYMDVPPTDDDIILCGYQRKLKTMKKKYFVLYKSTQYSVARLEYYDSEKKFKSKLPPKRVIELKNCFNINRRLDTKFEFVISLSTRDGGFGIVLESEQEMKKWLEVLIHFQRFETNATDAYHQHFDHVWQVQVQRKGLAEDKGIFGSFHVGLTNKSVTFIRIGSERSALGETRKTNIEFLLTTIRRCGDSQCFFYMEVGRQSITGPGELWMATEDSLTAQNMHKMILSAMSSKTDSTMEPMRKRSSSANEASKPINVMYRRQTQTECKTGNSPQCIQNYVRERCDSLPSRNRIPSESNNQSTVSIQNLRNTNNQRIQLLQRQSNSPPIGSTAVCSESEESSVSIEEQDDSSCLFTYRFHSRSSEGVIPEENTDEIIYTDNKTSEMQSKAENATLKNAIENYVSMAPVKNVSALTENNKVINLKPKHFLTDVRGRLPAPLNSELHRIEFTEIAADRLPKPEANEMETQVERPTRTFSIGSRIEHSRIHQRLTHSNENDANCRVRAFSVGSRSKIPQCELQNGSLHSKNSKDNFNSNNNILSNHHHSVSCPEKKSISAPLLLNKSHNSVDLMGDLMEIDFSKNVHLTNSLRCPAANTTLPKTFLTTNPEGKNNFYVDEPIVGDSKIVEMDHNFAQNDNGYLEMKPVGNTMTLRNTGPTVNELSALCTNSKQKLNTKMGALELNANEIVSNCEKERLDYKKTGNTSNTSKKVDVNLCKEKAKMRNDGDHESKDIICVTDSGISYNTKAKASIAKSRLISKKLLHSESDENNGTSKVNCRNKNFGYEQIKGDCCLDENKQTNRLHSSTSKYSSFNLQNGMHFGDESYPTATVSNLKECTETSSEVVKSSDLTLGSCYSNKKQQLYYASLDLSPSCTEYKNVSKDDNPNLSTPISTPVQTPSPSVNNLYAKIDFEYSDSSSSSNQVNA